MTEYSIQNADGSFRAQSAEQARAYDSAMEQAHAFPRIAACDWDRTARCTCPVWDVVERLALAGLLAPGSPS